MQIEKLDLKKTKNMRDMGGLPTVDGRKIKKGKLIRSGRLSDLPPETVDALVAMNVDNIIDLRTPKEIEEHTPTLIPTAEYHYLPLVATATREILDGKSMANIIYKLSKRVKEEHGSYAGYMKDMYDILAFDDYSVEILKQVFKLFLAEEKCIVFHCNSGTDRTGFISMLIESALGVGRDVIVEDYVASRVFQRRRRGWQRFGLKLSPISLKFKGVLYAMMFTEAHYITDLMDEMTEKYGSVVGYLKCVLNLTDADLALLKEKYLE